jgi:hypothetical protein
VKGGNDAEVISDWKTFLVNKGAGEDVHSDVAS